jgi:hypothetical protein
MHLWPDLPWATQEKLRSQLLEASADQSATTAQLIEHFGPGHAPSTAPLHLCRLQLFAAAGLPALPEDVSAFHTALTDASSFEHTAALRTLGVLLTGGWRAPADYHPVLLALIDGATYQGGYALFLALRFPPAPDSPWRHALTGRSDQERQRGKLNALYALVNATNQLPNEHEFRIHCLDQLAGLQTHAHRGLRNLARALLSGENR